MICRLLASALTVASLALTAAPAFGDGSSAQTVEQLAEQAYEQHAAGQYGDSIATYLKAYELGKASEILFNVATIYDRKLGERELAEDYYRRYIRQPDATPDLVRRAIERLTALKQEEDQQARKAVAPSPQPAPSPSIPPAIPPVPSLDPTVRDPTWRTTGLIVGATGAAGVIASLALGAAAKAKNDAANGECNGLSCPTQQGVSDAHDAGNYAAWSTVAAVVGGLALAGGIVLYVGAPRTSSAARSGTTLSLTSPRSGHGGAMSLSARF